VTTRIDVIPIIWPERRMVPTETLRNWFSDAVANGEIDAEESDGTLYQMCRALESAGIVTLADGWKDAVAEATEENRTG
jgi:hypothetical protein